MNTDHLTDQQIEDWLYQWITDRYVTREDVEQMRQALSELPDTPCPHVVTSGEGTQYCELARMQAAGPDDSQCQEQDTEQDDEALEALYHLYGLREIRSRNELGAKRALETICRALAERRAVPNGWKLVPTAPTADMVMAADGLMNEGEFTDGAKWWRAMLAAAPQLPASVELHEGGKDV